jgi:hypothetical protein
MATSHTWIQPSVVAKEALRQLINNLVFTKNCHRGYEDEFTLLNRGWEHGNTITIKAPVYFRVQDGNDCTSTMYNLVERSETMVLNQRKHIAWQITDTQMTLDIDQFSNRFIKPAMQMMANYIDSAGLNQYK